MGGEQRGERDYPPYPRRDGVEASRFGSTDWENQPLGVNPFPESSIGNYQTHW